MPDTSILNSSLILFLFVAFFGVLLLLVKKVFGNTRKSNNPLNMQILSKMSLQPRVNMYIVKAGGKVLLIGISDKNISTLSDLTPMPKLTKEQLVNNLTLTPNYSDNGNGHTNFNHNGNNSQSFKTKSFDLNNSFNLDKEDSEFSLQKPSELNNELNVEDNLSLSSFIKSIFKRNK